MMNIREAEISKTVADFLALYTPPRNIAGKQSEMQREMDRLIGIVLKFAPKEGWNGWVQSVLDQCAMTMKTRAWPTVGEIGAACSNARKEARQLAQSAAPVEFDIYELAASRMKAGEAVAETFLWGREAVEMIGRGLIDRDTMDRYRSAAFFNRRRVQGEEAALAWEAEAKARHESAKVARRERMVS